MLRGARQITYKLCADEEVEPFVEHAQVPARAEGILKIVCLDDILVLTLGLALEPVKEKVQATNEDGSGEKGQDKEPDNGHHSAPPRNGLKRMRQVRNE